MCTMNLSDGGIEAFRLTMNCAIGISLGDGKQRNDNHVSTTVKGGRKEEIKTTDFQMYQELTRR